MTLRDFSFRDLPVRIVGIATLVAVIAATAGAYAVGATNLFHHTYEVEVVLAETAGLKGGDPVRVAGIQVGRVRSVTPDFSKGQVVAALDVDAGVQLGPETTAEVALATLLGGRYVRLAGPVVRPFLEDLPRARRQIPLERTRLPLGVIDALGQLTKTADNIDANAVNELLRQAAGVAQDNAPQTRNLVDDVLTLSKVLNERRQKIDKLMSDTAQVTSALADRDTAIRRLIDASQALLAEIAARRDEVKAILGSGSAAAQSLADLIERNRTDLNTILGDLDATTSVLDKRLPQLNTALATAGPTVGAVADIGKTGPWVDVVLTGLSVIQLRDILKDATR